MRLLFKLDKGDYECSWKIYGKVSVGVEFGENYLQTLKREVREESGLIVIEKSVKEFGWVYRIEKGHGRNIWEQKNYYYVCNVENKILEQHLDKYEKEERFKLEFVKPAYALEINKKEKHKASKFIMLERESKILEILISEGYFDSEGKL